MILSRGKCFSLFLHRPFQESLLHLPFDSHEWQREELHSIKEPKHKLYENQIKHTPNWPLPVLVHNRWSSEYCLNDEMVDLIADFATKSNDMEIEPFRFGARWVICDFTRRCKTLTIKSYNKIMLSVENCFCLLKMSGYEGSSYVSEQNPTMQQWLGTLCMAVASSLSRANLSVGPSSGGFVLEPSLMEGSQPPSVTGTICHQRTSYRFSGDRAMEKINCHSGSSTPRQFTCHLFSLLVLGKIISYLIWVSYKWNLFCHHLLNLVPIILSSKVEFQASPVLQQIAKRELGGYRSTEDCYFSSGIWIWEAGILLELRYETVTNALTICYGWTLPPSKIYMLKS